MPKWRSFFCPFSRIFAQLWDILHGKSRDWESTRPVANGEVFACSPFVCLAGEWKIELKLTLICFDTLILWHFLSFHLLFYSSTVALNAIHFHDTQHFLIDETWNEPDLLATWQDSRWRLQWNPALRSPRYYRQYFLLGKTTIHFIRKPH